MRVSKEILKLWIPCPSSIRKQGARQFLYNFSVSLRGRESSKAVTTNRWMKQAEYLRSIHRYERCMEAALNCEGGTWNLKWFRNNLHNTDILKWKFIFENMLENINGCSHYVTKHKEYIFSSSLQCLCFSFKAYAYRGLQWLAIEKVHNLNFSPGLGNDPDYLTTWLLPVWLTFTF